MKVFIEHLGDVQFEIKARTLTIAWDQPEVCRLLEASGKPAGLVASGGRGTPKRHSV
jgi:hypothetical protein